MHLAPNNTPIEATVVEIEEDSLKIVLLKVPEQTLPAFLWQGKIVSAKNHYLPSDSFVEGDIITAEIEVRGDPFKQVYQLSNIEKTSRQDGF